MPAKPVKAKEQYRLVLECRSSGLTDYQWCGEKGICPGTFYGWVRRLRQKGYENIPEPVHSQRRDGRQEVVRIGAQTSALPEAFHCPKPCGAHIRYGTVHRRLCAPCAERYRSGPAAAGAATGSRRFYGKATVSFSCIRGWRQRGASGGPGTHRKQRPSPGSSSTG